MIFQNADTGAGNCREMGAFGKLRLAKTCSFLAAEIFFQEFCDFYLTWVGISLVSPCRDDLGGPTETPSRLMGFPWG
jgi:hypothetical protein